MYCSSCGSQIDDRTTVCPFCGKPIVVNAVPAADGSHANGWLKAVSLLFPLVGLILYLSYKDNQRRKAKDCGKFAIIGLFVALVFFVVAFVILVIVGVGSLGNYWYPDYPIQPV